MLTPTPSQTIGPFFAYCLTSPDYGYKLIANNIIEQDSGNKIEVSGKVLDGDQNPIPDAMLEIWQADPEGKFPRARNNLDPSIMGFARTETNLDGSFLFQSVKPGVFKNSTGVVQAAHINLNLFARGLIAHLTTRIYFSDEESTYLDPLMSYIPDQRRKTLIAQLESSEGDCSYYNFDINLQGENETVFLEWSHDL